ncbi:MAG: glycine--tRNA ligase subunit beta [Pseudomonadales bacterium]|nr:glycine--tRNA ligase subunit beta [Pseudomonadales bacterium]
MSAHDFLVEIGCGELPPKALLTLSQAFSAGLHKGLQAAQLGFDSIDAFAAPRRLALRVNALQSYQEDTASERIGPAVNAAYDASGKPTPAALGFARSCGVELAALQTVQKDSTEKLAYRSVKQGRKTADLLPELVTQALSRLPIPRKMRWGSSREEFVRPVHWVVMLFGDEVINTRILGIASGRETRGHRFHHPQAITINSPADYANQLQTTGKVLADYQQRKEKIRALIEREGTALKARVVIDEDLLDEVCSMVEWPVALTGHFDEAFLQVPAEALISSLKTHQKCFYVLDDAGQMLPFFIAVSNLDSLDPAQVVAGNERVIRPRLADAAFFFASDRKHPLASRQEQLKSIIFQQDLGSVYDKSVRVAALARFIATQLGAQPDWCERAAMLAKCDLLSNMVAEFAELQGIMGAHYARHDQEPEEVAAALNEQYLPRFSGDELPQTRTGCVLALAEKLDTMTGLFAIGQPPTGSRDPFALRRAALGVLRILVEKQLALDLPAAIEQSVTTYSGQIDVAAGTSTQVFEFLLERFRAWYQAEAVSAEVFQSVFVLKPRSPHDFNRRIHAVQAFSALPEAQALAAANKRVSNILQKQGGDVRQPLNPALLVEPAEIELARILTVKAEETGPLFAAGDYTRGLALLATIRTAVDTFFDEVLVMADDEALRNNRLALLGQLRELFLKVADISCLHTV